MFKKHAGKTSLNHMSILLLKQALFHFVDSLVNNNKEFATFFQNEVNWLDKIND